LFKDKGFINASDILLNSFVKNIKSKQTSNDICYQKACEEIAREILFLNTNNHNLKKEIFHIIKNKSSEYKLSKIPKNVDIIKLLPENNHYKKLLRLKPTKTSSGIAVITVMPMPFECPHGKCIYCPGGIEDNTPLSYVGTEPATKIAQQVNYDPFRQVWTKVIQLIERGHNVDKAELVIVGGTFPFYPVNYQKDFVKKCYDAFNLFDAQIFDKNTHGPETDRNERFLEFRFSENLEEAERNNEKSNLRCVGLTIETKPDYCKKEHVDTMLELGTTRIEIGVQSLSNEVYKAVNRGHDLNDVYEAFYLAKNCGYKIVAHMMPGLPKSTIQQDIDDFKKLFEDERLKPDMLKIYPTLVIKNTGLHKLFQEKKYNSYSTDDLVKILVEIKKTIPPWVRVMRIQREIESNDVVSGPKMGNLRQLVLFELERQGIKCKCIRCREIGLKNIQTEFSKDDLKLCRSDYFSSGGKEIFLSFETKDNDIIFGFLRLRLMPNPQRKELTGVLENGDLEEGKISSCIVRELHVYGPLARIGEKTTGNSSLEKNNYNNDSSGKIKGYTYQHKGLGQKLLKEAEKICKQEYNLKKVSVISAIGTREYYRKFGYTINGPYVTKLL
jgi:elongator complex protein 3